MKLGKFIENMMTENKSHVEEKVKGQLDRSQPFTGPSASVMEISVRAP